MFFKHALERVSIYIFFDVYFIFQSNLLFMLTFVKNSEMCYREFSPNL